MTTRGGWGVATGVAVGAAVEIEVEVGVADGSTDGVGEVGPLHAASSSSAAVRLRRLIAERYSLVPVPVRRNVM